MVNTPAAVDRLHFGGERQHIALGLIEHPTAHLGADLQRISEKDLETGRQAQILADRNLPLGQILPHHHAQNHLVSVAIPLKLPLLAPLAALVHEPHRTAVEPEPNVGGRIHVHRVGLSFHREHRNPLQMISGAPIDRGFPVNRLHVPDLLAGKLKVVPDLAEPLNVARRHRRRGAAFGRRVDIAGCIALCMGGFRWGGRFFSGTTPRFQRRFGCFVGPGVTRTGYTARRLFNFGARAAERPARGQAGNQ